MAEKSKEKSREWYEFKKQVETLKKFSGRGTELISVYITPKYPISNIAGKLRDEQGQASNIKSKSTRKSVLDALEKILHFLKSFKTPPENGIAIFCGNVSQKEGKSDVQLFSVIPPAPMPVQFYRCESKFVLEPLYEMMEQTGAYGIVVMDGKEATVALLKGKKLRVIKKLNSTAHQKVHKGGQSAARYDRLHVEGVEFYYKRVGAAMDAFVPVKAFKGVIVGGPGPAKQDFVKMKTFNYQLKILGVVDTGYTDEFGLREVLEKSKELISEQEAIQEKKLVDEFMREAVKGGLVAYGFDEIKCALEAKQASKLLVSEDLELKRVVLECSKCNKKTTRMVERLSEVENGVGCECGGKARMKSEEDVANELIGLAEDQAIPIEMISRDTAEGSQFYATFKGLGVFLRYK